MFDNPNPTPPTVDRRIAVNLLNLLGPRIQEAQALLEAAQALQAVAETDDPRSQNKGMGVRQALNSGGV
jgi:hypothetical protein